MNAKYLAVVLCLAAAIAFSGCLSETGSGSGNLANISGGSDNLEQPNISPGGSGADQAPLLPSGGPEEAQAPGDSPNNDRDKEVLEVDAAQLMPELINETDNVEIGEMI